MCYHKNAEELSGFSLSYIGEKRLLLRNSFWKIFLKGVIFLKDQEKLTGVVLRGLRWEREEELENLIEQDEHPEYLIEDDETTEKGKLKRELKEEAMRRLEEAARTEADFQNVISEWNRLDSNRERK